jgi:hypothetical protein
VKNLNRGLKFVSLNQKILQLIIFTDVSFVNNRNHSSQIDYVICLTDEHEKITDNVNIIHWSSIKCKRVIRSALASELYAMTHEFDAELIFKGTMNEILKELKSSSLFLIICTNSKSLYDCLVKLGSVQEKRLMINVMCLRQAYERREIAEMRWIHEENNPADSMIKIKSSRALEKLIDTNIIDMSRAAWVERGNKIIWLAEKK